MKLLPAFMLTKTNLCKHNLSCGENVLTSFASSFVNILCMKFMINNLFYLSKLSKLIKNLTSTEVLMDNLKYALFCAMMNTTYKLVLCLMRRLFKSDKVSAPIAGFMAGLWSAIEAKKRMQLLQLFLIARTCDSAAKMSVDHGIVGRIPHVEVLLYFVCSCFQQYLMAFERDCMSSGIGNFF